ncbi:HNH endonuclease signature motif containing protein [Ilumatobacter coccineus]|nr:HNH endonuclease signature motif containing protein [Ilumatobacter coccineus]
MFSEVVESLVGLSDDDVVARIEANELERRRLDAEMAALLAIADRRNIAGSEGHRSMTGFCRARLNWSTAEATRRIGQAKAVDHVADLGSLWYDGRFGAAQATKLSMTYGNQRVRDQLPEFAPMLLDNAEHLPYSDFAAMVDHFESRADADGAHDDRDAQIEGRRARVVDVGGTLDIRASGGDGLTTAEMLAIHDHFTELEYQADLEARRAEHGGFADGFALARTDRQRRFDALVNLFRTAMSANAAGVAAVPAEPVVNIVIDAHTWGRMLADAELSARTGLDGRPVDPFTGLTADASRELLADATALSGSVCETVSGVPLHGHDVLRAALAGHIRRTVVDARRVVIDQGRKQRLFTGSARRAAKMLIRHCEHAGCELPADWCDVDHIDEWDRDGGATDQRNAAVLCGHHNTDKHRRRWRTRRATNGHGYTIRADGTIVLPVGARPPDFPVDHDHDEDDDDDAIDPAETARLTSLARYRIDALARATA